MRIGLEVGKECTDSQGYVSSQLRELRHGSRERPCSTLNLGKLRSSSVGLVNGTCPQLLKSCSEVFGKLRE